MKYKYKGFIHHLLMREKLDVKNDYNQQCIAERDPYVIDKKLSKCLIFIKFVSKKYFKNFAYYGELHFGNIKDYRSKGFYDPVIGDINESTFRTRFHHGKIILRLGNKKISHSLKNNESIDVKQYFNNNSAIFSVSRLDKSDFYKVSDRPNEFKIRPKVINKLFINFKSEDKVPVIITNIKMIYYLLISTLNKERVLCNLFQGPVRYYPFLDYKVNGQKNALRDIFNHFQGPLNNLTKDKLIAFTKSKPYSYQREFRFLLSTNLVLDNHNNIRIGNIVKYLRKVTKKDLLSLTIDIDQPNDNVEIKELKQLWNDFPPYSNICCKLMNNVKPEYVKTNNN